MVVVRGGGGVGGGGEAFYGCYKALTPAAVKINRF